MIRPALFRHICKLVGAPPIVINDIGTGWPGLMSVTLPSDSTVNVAMHVSIVGPHARRDYEYRFQNPANRSPVVELGDHISILVGLEESGPNPILVAVDGQSRVDRQARFSILFHRQVLDEARIRGWAVYTSSSGENIYAFHPALLPIFVEMLTSGIDSQPAVTASADIASATLAAGLLDEDTTASRKRARRAAEVLVRHHAFGNKVVRAYQGYCAMCGLDFGLVVGAHIYPASAPGSPDRIWNGLALCHNHHAAFDSHRIWVEPATTNIRIHPELLSTLR